MSSDAKLHWNGLDGMPHLTAKLLPLGSKKATATLASSFDSIHDTKKAKRITNATLDPHSGALQIWLDDHDHYPLSPKQSSQVEVSADGPIQTKKQEDMSMPVIAAVSCFAFPVLSPFTQWQR